MSLDLISPIEGPPRTRIISDEDPPSSETGSTKYALVGLNAVQIAFPPVPPETTTKECEPALLYCCSSWSGRTRMMGFKSVVCDCDCCPCCVGRSNTDDVGLDRAAFKVDMVVGGEARV